VIGDWTRSWNEAVVAYYSVLQTLPDLRSKLHSGRSGGSRSLSRLELSIHMVNYMGHAVAQLVEAYRYKSGVRGFDPRWPWGRLSLGQMSTRNISMGVKATSCADSRNLGTLILVEPLGPAQACNGIALPSPLWSTMYIQGSSVQLKSGLKNTGTWSAADWPHRLVCYLPAIFLSSFSHCAFIRTRKNAALYKNITSPFLRNFIFTVLELRKSEIA
jgi:hypothetical protein